MLPVKALLQCYQVQKSTKITSLNKKSINYLFSNKSYLEWKKIIINNNQIKTAIVNTKKSWNKIEKSKNFIMPLFFIDKNNQLNINSP